MKKLLMIAAITAMTASTGAWAACSANIELGGFKVTGSGEVTSADDDATLATKAYVDAAGGISSCTAVTGQTSVRYGKAGTICPAGSRLATYTESVQYCGSTVGGSFWVAHDPSIAAVYAGLVSFGAAQTAPTGINSIDLDSLEMGLMVNPGANTWHVKLRGSDFLYHRAFCVE